jgi:ATP-binding cassette subfamily F protein uup
VEHLFAFEGDGVIRDYPGNYSQYREGAKRDSKEIRGVKEKKEEKLEEPMVKIKTKLSFKEKHEFEKIEKELPQLQTEKATLEEKMNLGLMPFEELQKAAARIGELAQLIDEKEMRWLELSEKI